MTYSSDYKPERYDCIRGILETISNLEPGHEAEFLHLEDNLKRVKYLLYEWMHHNQVKNRFRIKINWPLNKLTVARLGDVINTEARIITPRANIDTFVEELIMLEPEDPEEVVLNWKAEGRITTLEDATRILSAYEKAMS